MSFLTGLTKLGDSIGSAVSSVIDEVKQFGSKEKVNSVMAVTSAVASAAATTAKTTVKAANTGAAAANKPAPSSQTQQAPANTEKKVSVFQQQTTPTEETYHYEDLGHGHTKVINQNGVTVQVIVDDSKTDGTSFLFDSSVEFVHINSTAPQEKSFWEKADDWLTSVDNAVSNLTQGYVRRFGHGMAGWLIPTTVAVAATAAPVATGVVTTGVAVTSCGKKDNVIYQNVEETIYKTETIEGETIPGNITPEEWQKTKNTMLNSVISNINSGNPKTADGVGYRYEIGKDGNGTVVIKNKNGTDSTIKLGFTPQFDISDEKTDPATGNYSAVLTLTATATGTVSNSNVVEYINIIGGKPKTSAGDEYSFILQNGNVVTKYGDTGFTHILGQSATVTATSPLGKTQKMLTDLGLLPEMNGKIATHEKTSTGAYAGNGILFEVVPGDLKEVTTGNPRVKMSFNAIKDHQINIEGKLSVDNKGVVTITADDGTKVTLTKKSVVDIAGDDYNNGISVAVNGRETYRMASDAGRIEMAYVEDDGSTDTTTNFKPSAPDVFDGGSAVKESDAYFDEKLKNLEDAYKTAVGSIYASETLTKSGSKTNYTVEITIHTEAGTETKVKTN